MCDNHKKNNKKGATLKDKVAHEKDHINRSRRSFIRNMGLAGGMSMFLGKMPVSAAAFSPLSVALNNGTNDRILILIQLNGGNDGLNTFVPMYDYDYYRNQRSTIGLLENQLINLDDNYSMPTTMQPLQPFWEDGKMKVVQSVGYAQQNLSHFTSSDIWASASNPDEISASGWMGRNILAEYPDFFASPPEAPPAIQIGGVANLAFNDSASNNLAVSVRDPEELAEIAENGELFSTANLPDCYYGEQVGFMRTITNTTFTYAGVISEAYAAGSNDPDAYGLIPGQLSRQLARVARLIKGGLGTKIYMVTLNGFDTHALQSTEHPALLTELAAAVSGFYADLQAGGMGEDVLCATFSEFGRRIEQNASDGTDHGAAAPLMLFGEALNGNGFLGQQPDLHNVDNHGNLTLDIDFRQVYATLLEHWLCVDALTVDTVLGATYTRIDLGFNCDETTDTDETVSNYVAITHEVRYTDNGDVKILYNLPASMDVSVNIMDILGKPIAQLQNGHQYGGKHELTFERTNRMSSGYYIVLIKAGGQLLSSRIKMINK